VNLKRFVIDVLMHLLSTHPNYAPVYLVTTLQIANAPGVQLTVSPAPQPPSALPAYLLFTSLPPAVSLVQALAPAVQVPQHAPPVFQATSFSPPSAFSVPFNAPPAQQTPHATHVQLATSSNQALVSLVQQGVMPVQQLSAQYVKETTTLTMEPAVLVH